MAPFDNGVENGKNVGRIFGDNWVGHSQKTATYITELKETPCFK
jgi:hypothetical protein